MAFNAEDNWDFPAAAVVAAEAAVVIGPDHAAPMWCWLTVLAKLQYDIKLI
jgi:hypothetical protein